MKNDANDAVLAGLRADQAVLPPKLFYDQLGSRLFTAICAVPEYYPTRTEAAIFRSSANKIAQHLRKPYTMIDLGAGDCRKAAGLFAALGPASYTGVDISGDFLVEATADLQREFPDIQIEPLVRDFTQAWSLPDAMMTQPVLFFYPGSSISNFTPEHAVEFLKTLCQMGGPGSTDQRSLLIGVDMVKDAAVLEAAYDDALGVTAAFNRNMLLHANRLLETNFAVADWDHRAVFNQEQSRIEMHLVARRSLQVAWPTGTRVFEAGEFIHTENSYKYTPDSFNQVLDAAGFRTIEQYQDEQQGFLVVLAAC